MTREKIGWIVAAIGALLLLVVFAQNFQDAKVTILFASITMPLVVLLIATALGGYMLGLLTGGGWIGRGRSKKKTPSDTPQDG